MFVERNFSEHENVQAHDQNDELISLWWPFVAWLARYFTSEGGDQRTLRPRQARGTSSRCERH